MQSTCRLHDTAHLTGLESKGRILEFFLHVALAKVAEIAALAGRGAVGFGGGELTEGDFARLDSGLVGFDDLEGVVSGAGDFRLGQIMSAGTRGGRERSWRCGGKVPRASCLVVDCRGA